MERRAASSIVKFADGETPPLKLTYTSKSTGELVQAVCKIWGKTC